MRSYARNLINLKIEILTNIIFFISSSEFIHLSTIVYNEVLVRFMAYKAMVRGFFNNVCPDDVISSSAFPRTLYLAVQRAVLLNWLRVESLFVRLDRDCHV